MSRDDVRGLRGKGSRGGEERRERRGEKNN